MLSRRTHLSARTRISLAMLLLAAVSLPGCATTELYSRPEIQVLDRADAPEAGDGDRSGPGLKVMTLNLAHGRGDSFHQLLQKSATTRSNLDEVAAVLNELAPDIVALQEADAASFWSGRMDHVHYLASNGPFNRSVHATHADGLGVAYGTALVSRHELFHPEAITFDPALAITPKGFVVSTISWPGQPCLEVDIASVHLDFSSEETRRLQATALVETLAERNRPLILMGDFNTDWSNPDSALGLIATGLGLNAYRPDSTDMHTFPLTGARLDWILVSPELEFTSYEVLPDILSDHRAVIAKITLHQRPDSARR